VDDGLTDDTFEEGQVSEVTAFACHGANQAVCACHFDDALAALGDPNVRVWINFLAPDQAHLLKVVAKLGFHELAVEDVFSPRSRAKIEEYAGHLFCIMPALNPNTEADPFDTINLNAFLGSNYLITAQRAPLPAVAALKYELERGSASVRRGPDFALYRLLDAIVDEYLPLADAIGERIEALEERIFEQFDRTVSADIFRLKRDVALLRRRMGPQREIINSLTNRPHEMISPETQIYLRDVYDHVFRINDNVDTFRDLLQGALDSYLTQVSNRTNEVMKLLSIVATIVLPLNMLTGLYGTNFGYLPGAENPYGFWIFCAGLLSVGLLATLLFRLRRLL